MQAIVTSSKENLISLWLNLKTIQQFSGKKKTKNNRTGAVGSWEQWQHKILKPPLKSKTAPIPAGILLLHLGQMAGTKALKLTC